MRMMKSFLRSVVWWPKLDSGVEIFIRSCRECTLVAAPNAPEPMLRKALPSGPWEDIAIDFLGPLPNGQHLLVAVDCYSRYLEVCEIGCTDSAETIICMLEMFSRYGVPSKIKTDNGPQFASEEFGDFCVDYNIQLVHTIPYWPQMNGQVERQNRSILKRLQIAQELGKDWRKELREYLLVYHATNHSTTGEAPSKLMLGRRIKTRLPQVPGYVDDEAVRDFDGLQKEKGREYADKRRRAEFSDIREGDRVFIKRMMKSHKLEANFSSEEFVVMKKTGSDVVVRSQLSGKEFRRNDTHLKKIPSGHIDSQHTTLQSEHTFRDDPVRDPEQNDQQLASNAGPDRISQEEPVPDSGNVQQQDEPARSKRACNQPSRFRDYVPH
ncbi:uncharacterized protein K02A2.6-like [Wyeomyia smithii]|uniref:uncharacterized protein K02A2.6-like n=1 Tax=Wyeomyia smithii TaxID=174621 RepID=UPI00246803C1|nr:uncharacterized protein K02A2.6-like [Wyeomyia smithii]XP_055525200.1 uncharacterized protein K02A2.6-like [Wyeomyia smithii]XP_055525205.1 uncharacterized protein K02A2.6-like [Wyeomyia smithii]